MSAILQFMWVRLQINLSLTQWRVDEPTSAADVTSRHGALSVCCTGLVILISIICAVTKCLRNRKAATKQNNKGNISYSTVNDPVQQTLRQTSPNNTHQGSDSGVSTEQETRASKSLTHGVTSSHIRAPTAASVPRRRHEQVSD